MDMTITNLSQAPAPAALAGPDLIRWLASDPAVRDRELTDGRHTLSYADAARFLERLDAHFAHRGVSLTGTGDSRPTLAVECSQSLAGALALLHLLSREYSVVLLPELAETSKETGTPRFIPSFCSHVLTASGSGGRPDADFPANGIEIAANPDFAAEPAVADFVGPDLYLRTSGSTGVPKLTRMSHQKWLNNAQGCVDRWRLTSDDRLAVPVPIFHSYGFGAAFLPGLLAGAAMDFGGGANILRYLEREERFDPNVAFLTPAFCDTFLTLRKTPRPYRLVVTAGDKVKRETMAGFEPRFGPLLNLYGSAEMGAVSAAAAEDPEEQRLGTAGYPFAGIELRVEPTGEEIAAVSEAPGPVGEEGEQVGLLQCRQQNGSVGYLMLDEGWRFAPRGDNDWFATGDLARIRPDGYVEILGRSGLSVKRDGLLVVFADVEAAVEKVPGVQRAVVVAGGETRRGVKLVAVCLAEDATLTPDAVRKSCFDLLPRYAVPDDVLIVESLPQTPSGKIDRRALRDLVAG
jgi:acyl-CoA synthetase (AMP-forming)/AMP-acid ligase II